MTLMLIGTTEIETDNLMLRPFTLEDADDMYKNWAGDPIVTRYLTWQPHSGVAESMSVITGWINGYKNNSCYTWAIVLKQTGDVIGSISLTEINMAAQWCEIGYCIGRAYWGRGIATEALGFILHHTLTVIGANRVQALHDVNNPASGRVMKKCGMTYEGLLRQYSANNTGIVDVCIYSIFRENL